MLFLTVVVSILGTLSVMQLLIIASLYKDTVNNKVILTQISSLLATLVGRSQAQEMYLQKLGSSFTEFANLSGNMLDKIGHSMLPGHSREYRTMDGKYSAGTLEELLGKIREDGVEDKYMSKEDIDNLRKMFEDDDDDDDIFNQNKKRF